MECIGALEKALEAHRQAVQKLEGSLTSLLRPTVRPPETNECPQPPQSACEIVLRISNAVLAVQCASGHVNEIANRLEL